MEFTKCAALTNCLAESFWNNIHFIKLQHQHSLNFQIFVIARMNFNEIQAFVCGFGVRNLAATTFEGFVEQKLYCVHNDSNNSIAGEQQSYVFCEFPASKFLNHYNLLERNKLHIYLPRPFVPVATVVKTLVLFRNRKMEKAFTLRLNNHSRQTKVKYILIFFVR